ncbi:hypothetical protein CDD82_5684 [Ophiocordyceps australis]|uniref:Fungal lipase-type domain-containing protein n=1 Tax=Ophiocordyceps australis TaxID=1399860 RepID=A0A2C5YZI9_9HYPO|nr:hypothetical protein CDD82_5684 [Ophiocordyceps australis]
MYVESVPADDARTVVVAIRGTASFADWAVNLRAEPAAPERFLDDCGNACHAGFLDVARTMVAPVADRLRRILQDDPARTAHSLVLTGHSAGGAVASLVYLHMLAREASCQSELNALTACFSNIHCITFGAPPVSLLPLQKPKGPELGSSLFLSFVNQGDPVVRAGKAYIKSLVDLLRSPSPCLANASSTAQPSSTAASRRWLQKSWPKSSKPASGPFCPGSTAPIWVVPPCTLSNGGLIVVLRSYDVVPPPCRGVKQMMEQGVVAVTSCDEQLRSVIWGDPMRHHMKLYAARVESLAVEAVVREMD